MRAVPIATTLLVWAALGGGCGQEQAPAQAGAGGAPPSGEAVAPPAAIPELSVDQVASLLEAGGCVTVDANSESTRREEGVVPGAILLTSSGRYDPSAELPADPATKLVFYCGNEECHASDGAAERARQAGYRDVHVMRAGIAGWRAAGKSTAPMPEA